MFDGDLYVGGNFTSVGKDTTVSANNIAYWNGTTWNPLSVGNNNGTETDEGGATVNALKTWQTDPDNKATEQLFAGYRWSQINGLDADTRLLAIWSKFDNSGMPTQDNHWRGLGYNRFIWSGSNCGGNFYQRNQFIGSLAIYGNQMISGGALCIDSNSIVSNGASGFIMRKINMEGTTNKPSFVWEYGRNGRGSGGTMGYGSAFSYPSGREVNDYLGGFSGTPNNGDALWALFSFIGNDKRSNFFLGGIRGLFNYALNDSTQLINASGVADSSFRAFVPSLDGKTIYIAGKKVVGNNFIAQASLTGSNNRLGNLSAVGNWVASLSGQYDQALRMVNINGQLYVGGIFNNAGINNVVNNIVKINPVNGDLSPLGHNGNNGVTRAPANTAAVSALLVAPSLEIPSVEISLIAPPAEELAVQK